MINAGSLTRRITLQYPAVARGTDGSAAITYTDDTIIWAEHVSSAGKEFYAAQKINAEVTDVFRIRYCSGLDTRWRLKFGNRNLQITFIDYSGQRDGELLLHCKEVE